MTSARTAFKRLVVGLPQNRASEAAIAAAADLAEFLQIELLATFIADSNLRSLAELPVARELRTLGQGWQAIDVAQMVRQIDHATNLARRRFAESVRSRAVKASFDVVSEAEGVASLIRADDIVAIIEPTHPGETITRRFTGLVAAALEAASAILAVPRQIRNATGPIMALPAGPEDASIRVALEIAAVLKERLIVVTRPGATLTAKFRDEADRFGVRVEELAASGSAPAVTALGHSPLRSRERLRVVAGSRLPAAHRLFSTLGGVPLLVIDPEQVFSDRQ